ncbi:DUF11 domain-containing protein [Paractinoplanes globisporus]|uniref:DUF11 domain-containing protein n=1 Tax=Paractinoplanes globisporus TaxID=113565 RepID=A0ABW6W9G2_9ACTN|nr:DUF11 domain-containing protein [Actinoplanes globisporus]
MHRSFGRRLLIVAAAAIAVGSAFAAPANAALISVKMFLPDVLVGAGASADIHPIVVGGSHYPISSRMDYELSGDLEGVRLAAPEDNGLECTSDGPRKLTCAATPTQPGDPFGYAEQHAVIAADPSALGGTGKLTMSLSAGSIHPVSLTVDVSVVDGVDLTAGGSSTISVKPGATFDAPLQVHNNTDKVVHGAAVTVDAAYAFTAGKQFSNCLYLDGQSNSCVFDQDLEPGATYEVTLPFRPRPDTYAPGKVVGDFEWLTTDDYQNLIKFLKDNGLDGPGTPGTGPKLELKRTGTVGSLARQTDTNPADNTQSLTVNVTGKQGADLAAVGATASGAAGTTVTLPIGVRNNGPATLELPAGNAIGVHITFPAGTEVVAEPDVAVTPGGCYQQTGTPHVTYVCYTGEFAPFVAKTTITLKFQVKITKVIANAEGSVEVDDSFNFSKDINPANNVAKIVLNPATGGGTGGEGGGEGLPITGPQTALIGGAGTGLVAVGLVGFVLARRRRTRFEA